jgi:DNA-directed RNA polymerase subunit M/transcription elongation factor TFIIS
MTSTVRYSGPSVAGTVTCPNCKKLMITSYLDKTTEAGVAFQCPNCYEWLRVREVLDVKAANFTKEQVRRSRRLEIVRLSKEEITKMLQKNKTAETEIFEWEA